jgi:nitronate monooxygenase
VNFIVPVMDRASLELAVQRAPYIDFFLADPDPALVEVVHAGGAICGWQVESGRNARAAAATGCDVVIAKSWESGGRKGLEGPTLLPLLDAVLDAVSVPVIAAGGIASARGVAAALATGAHGVRVGTRFIAASESDAHPAWVQAVVDAAAEDAVVTTAFNVGLPEPGPHRVLRSSIEAAEALADDQAGVLRLAGAEIPVARFGAQPPTRESTGPSRRCRSTPVSPRARFARSNPQPRSWPSSPQACRRARDGDQANGLIGSLPSHASDWA